MSNQKYVCHAIESRHLIFRFETICSPMAMCVCVCVIHAMPHMPRRFVQKSYCDYYRCGHCHLSNLRMRLISMIMWTISAIARIHSFPLFLPSLSSACATAAYRYIGMGDWKIFEYNAQCAAAGVRFICILSLIKWMEYMLSDCLFRRIHFYYLFHSLTRCTPRHCHYGN